MITKSRKIFSGLTGATALGTIMLLGMHGFAYAQQVTFTGDNASYVNGCEGPRDLPDGCPSAVATPLADATQDHFVFPDYYLTGIMVGTNFTDAHGGASAHGSVDMKDGGTIYSAFVYVGHEQNTSGILNLDGVGTEWLSHSAGSIGHYGDGEMYITGGASFRQVNPDAFYTGYGETSTGYVHVTGVDVATDTRSTLHSAARIYVGRAGNATMLINDGGHVISDYTSVMGEFATSHGIMIIEGVHEETGYASTFHAIHNQFWVGWEGKATIHVLDGGLFKVGDGIQIVDNDSIVLVSGVHAGTGTRSTVEANLFQSGYMGTAHASVLNGGLVHANFVRMGRLATGNGTLLVDGVDAASGQRSEVWANTSLSIGAESPGAMIVRNGALAHSDNTVLLGDFTTIAHGNLTVHGQGSEVIAAGHGTIGRIGEGILNLEDHGLFRADGVTMAETSTGIGTLNIGTGGVAGVLDTDTITGGLGNSEINFNHSNDIGFAPQLTGNIAHINKYNNSTTTLMAESDYTGATNVLGGVLRAGMQGSFSANSGFDVHSNAILDLNGHSQSIDSLHHAGILRLGGQGGTTLHIDNGLVSDGGVYEFNVVLGDDNSVTDLITTSHTTGTGFIKVKNINGLGDVTNDGIKLIDASGSHDGNFTLLGDYIHEGEQAVVGGAYAYKLHTFQDVSGTSGATFLYSSLMPTSAPDPLYQAGVPVYEVYPQALQAMNAVGTLQQRVGNRSWAIADGQGASANKGKTSRQYAMPEIERGGVWTRIDGAHHHTEPDASRSVEDFRQNMIKTQIGIDKVLDESDGGKIIGGLYGQYTHAKTDVSSIHGDGKISTNGYGAGLSATWYRNDHSYIDTQAQATWYKSDLDSTLTDRKLVKGNEGIGYAVSVEAGKRMQMSPRWSLTPQLQLSYSNVDHDSFNDIFDARVSLQKSRVLEGRAGLAVEQERRWTGNSGKAQSQHLYGIANLYYDFLHGSRVDVAETRFSAKDDRLWGGVGLGGSHNWNDGQYSVYGEVTTNTSLENFGDSYSARGSVGFRFRW